MFSARPPIRLSIGPHAETLIHQKIDHVAAYESGTSVNYRKGAGRHFALIACMVRIL